LTGWPTAFCGPEAWLQWHKDAVDSSNPANVTFVAVDSEADNRIVGSILGRVRTWDYGLAEEEAMADEQSGSVAVVVDGAFADKPDLSRTETLMNFWESSYKHVTKFVRPLIQKDRSYIHVRQMLVAEGYRAQGIGSQLLGLLLAEARKQNVAVQLESWGRGRDFYKKHGARDAGVVVPLEFGGGPGAEQTIMVWYE
ncbi:hypothetical protein BC830DRAFT_1140688, partial [Chytriomyces sp. MP71]